MAGGGRDVVGVEAAHGLLGLEAGEDQVVAAEARAEEGVHGLGGGSGGGRGGAQARPEWQALGEVDGDRVGADAEGAERSHGGHASCRLWVERKEGGAEVAGVLARGGRKRMHWVVCWRSEFMGYESFYCSQPKLIYGSLIWVSIVGDSLRRVKSLNYFISCVEQGCT